MVVGTWMTGLALAIFAYLTYKLSRQMTEFRYNPVLEIHPLDDRPKTGEVKRVSSVEYYGVKWEVCLINPGEVPVWVERIEIMLTPTSRESWSTIDSFCELFDKEGHPVHPRIAIPARDRFTITILVCDEKTKEYLKWQSPGESEFEMKVILFQERRLGKSPGWVDSRISGKFSLPEKFGKATRL